jgi:hypothetical protein
MRRTSSTVKRRCLVRVPGNYGRNVLARPGSRPMRRQKDASYSSTKRSMKKKLSVTLAVTFRRRCLARMGTQARRKGGKGFEPGPAETEHRKSRGSPWFARLPFISSNREGRKEILTDLRYLAPTRNVISQGRQERFQGLGYRLGHASVGPLIELRQCEKRGGREKAWARETQRPEGDLEGNVVPGPIRGGRSIVGLGFPAPT